MMQFTEFGNQEGKTLLLLPGTACTWQLNFKHVADELAVRSLEKLEKVLRARSKPLKIITGQRLICFHSFPVRFSKKP